VTAASRYFSRDYAEARDRFRQAARRCSELIALQIVECGPDREPLTIDVAWFGAAHPHRLLVHMSGVHGVEGFAGSAIQLYWITEEAPTLADGQAVVVVHVVNPFGMAWLRRVNAHNVDLNRNCLFGERHPSAPPGYSELDRFLNPSKSETSVRFYWHALRLLARHRLTTLRAAIAGGQYMNPSGLFFGGMRLEEETRLLGDMFQERLNQTVLVVGIDVHTGLGQFGRDTLIVPDTSDTEFESLRRTFGDRVTSSDPEHGPAYRATGTIDRVLRHAAPRARLDFLVQEFGTYPSVRVLRALREENRRYRWRAEGSSSWSPDPMLLDVFMPASQAWRAAVLDRGRVVIHQALGHLAEGPTAFPS
jgi:hypothetical protein